MRARIGLLGCGTAVALPSRRPARRRLACGRRRDAANPAGADAGATEVA